jgi:hypothetical protein
MPPEVVKLDIRVNAIYSSTRFAGPYEPVGKWWFTPLDGGWGYIAKVLPDPAGRDVMLIAQDLKLSRPYPVIYADDGSVSFGPPSASSP